MNFLNENAKIGSLVEKKPEYANVFEKFGLDYCCKGDRTLKEACDEKKLNINEVLDHLKQIQTSDGGINWSQMSMKEMIESIIDKYHLYLRQELPRISQLLKKIKIKHGQRYAYISDLQNIFENMKGSLLKHIDEEEQLVFPLVMNLEVNKDSHKEEIKKYLSSLDEDHLEAGEALEKMKELTNGYTPPSDACMSHIVMLNSLERLERNLHEHIHKENQILFPRVKAML